MEELAEAIKEAVGEVVGAEGEGVSEAVGAVPRREKKQEVESGQEAGITGSSTVNE